MRPAGVPDGVKRDAVYEFIAEWISKNGYAPSFREIGDGLGIKSMSTVSYHVNRLEDEGRIERPPGTMRAYVLVGGEKR